MLCSISLVLIIATLGHSGAYSKSITDQPSHQAFDYRDYAAVLKGYVDDTGMVDYRVLKANPEKLDSLLQSLSKLDPNAYGKWSEPRKVAFWLNAYNAFTLKAIIDNYPIKPSFFRSAVYPKNSIRQIAGVWDELTFNVMGQDLTLEYIEHEILRKQFSEPGIHMALVCAAMGCPSLRNEPYFGNRLCDQLDDQARKFLGDPQKFRIDRRKGVLYLSPIFKWFGKDFVDKYAAKKKHAGKGESESAVLNFLTEHVDESEADLIASAKFKIKYLEYDWALNEQQARQKSAKK